MKMRIKYPLAVVAPASDSEATCSRHSRGRPRESPHTRDWLDRGHHRHDMERKRGGRRRGHFQYFKKRTKKLNLLLVLVYRVICLGNPQICFPHFLSMTLGNTNNKYHIYSCISHSRV